MVSPYDQIAACYFTDRHKTCRAFDASTKANICLHLPLNSNGPRIEVGAGKGRMLEYTGLCADVHVDSSESMLRLQPREPGLCVIAEGNTLPFLSNYFDLMTGFLIDPFLDEAFVAEAHRVLAPNGQLLISTPSYEWGVALRGGEKHETTFITTDGQKVVCPSRLHTQKQLRKLLSDFNDVHLTLCRLPCDHEAPPAIVHAAEVAGCTPYELVVIYLVSARK